MAAPEQTPEGRERVPRSLVEALGRLFDAVAQNGGEIPSLHDVEKLYMQFVLDEVRGNKARAASILKLDRKTLYARIKKLRLDVSGASRKCRSPRERVGGD